MNQTKTQAQLIQENITRLQDQLHEITINLAHKPPDKNTLRTLEQLTAATRGLIARTIRYNSYRSYRPADPGEAPVKIDIAALWDQLRVIDALIVSAAVQLTPDPPETS